MWAQNDNGAPVRGTTIADKPRWPRPQRPQQGSRLDSAPHRGTSHVRKQHLESNPQRALIATHHDVPACGRKNFTCCAPQPALDPVSPYRARTSRPDREPQPRGQIRVRSAESSNRDGATLASSALPGDPLEIALLPQRTPRAHPSRPMPTAGRGLWPAGCEESRVLRASSCEL
jgi:hypothetical protein